MALDGRTPPDRFHLPATAPAIALAFGAGALIAGGLISQRRRAEQRRRVRGHPDDAPPRTRRASPAGAVVTGRSVTINRPRADLYAFWRDLRNLPRFMEHVEKVVQNETGRATWTISTPGGGMTLETEITEDRPNERIAWRSVEGSDITVSGAIAFHDAPAGRGAVVEATVAWRPPAGQFGRRLAQLFQSDPGTQGRHNLKRFKMLMETGEIATSRNHAAEA